MTEGEKINAIHALQNALNPRCVGAEEVQLYTTEQKKVVTDKLIEIIESLEIK